MYTACHEIKVAFVSGDNHPKTPWLVASYNNADRMLNKSTPYPRGISTSSHVQCRLPTLWVRHLDDLDVRGLGDAAHRLWGDEDELSTD